MVAAAVAGTTTMENRSRSRSAMVTLTPSTAMGDLATSREIIRSGGRIQTRRQPSSASTLATFPTPST